MMADEIEQGIRQLSLELAVTIVASQPGELGAGDAAIALAEKFAEWLRGEEHGEGSGSNVHGPST